MSAFVYVTVYDRCNFHNRTRVRCRCGGFSGLYISRRQYRDACLRVRLIYGSYLCADYDTDICVYDHNGDACGLIRRR